MRLCALRGYPPWVLTHELPSLFLGKEVSGTGGHRYLVVGMSITSMLFTIHFVCNSHRCCEASHVHQKRVAAGTVSPVTPLPPPKTSNERTKDATSTHTSVSSRSSLRPFRKVTLGKLRLCDCLQDLLFLLKHEEKQTIERRSRYEKEPQNIRHTRWVLHGTCTQPLRYGGSM